MPDPNSTILDTPATTTPGDSSSSNANGGDSNVNPAGNGTLLDPQPGSGEPPKPNGDSQDPTKAVPPDGKPVAPNDPGKPATGAPEAYQPFKVPEGFALNPQGLEAFTKIAKEANLSQDVAQKLVDLQTQVVQSTTAQLEADFQKMTETWKQETRKELGPDAEKQLAFASKAREMFASPKLMQELRDSGFGNHPEMVKFFIAVGKAVSEDSFPEGKNRKGGDKTAAEILYPSLPK